MLLRTAGERQKRWREQQQAERERARALEQRWTALTGVEWDRACAAPDVGALVGLLLTERLRRWLEAWRKL